MRQEPDGDQQGRRGVDRHGDRGVRDASPALRARPLVGEPRRTTSARGRRARQAPDDPLRGWPHDPLAPADDRVVGRLSARQALAPRQASRVVGHPHRRPRGRPVRRTRSRADDRWPDPLRSAHQATRAGRAGRGVRRCRVPAAAARRRSDPHARRRAARPADRGRHREHVEGRGVLARGDRSMAAPIRRLGCRGARGHPRNASAYVRVGAAGLPEIRGHDGLPPRRHPVPALPGEGRGARPGRRQPHDVLVPGVSALKRVGHKGADLVAPGNTVPSFEAALEHGVDMIEFDVLRLRDGRLVLAHDYEDAAKREPLTLEEGLDHFAGQAYGGIELDIDMKLPGYEKEVVDGLVSRGLAERSLISTHYIESLDKVGAMAPQIRRGISVPQVRRDYTKTPLAVPAYGVARVMRARLPAKAQRLLREGRIEAVMAHWLLVSKRLGGVGHAEGGEVYVWTVDDAAKIEKLRALGVHAVISNDPRLFS